MTKRQNNSKTYFVNVVLKQVLLKINYNCFLEKMNCLYIHRLDVHTCIFCTYLYTKH